jgi:hypothetical protein
MQVSIQFPSISVTILEVLYVVYIINTLLREFTKKCESIRLIPPELQRLEK